MECRFAQQVDCRDTGDNKFWRLLVNQLNSELFVLQVLKFEFFLFKAPYCHYLIESSLTTLVSDGGSNLHRECVEVASAVVCVVTFEAQLPSMRQGGRELEELRRTLLFVLPAHDLRNETSNTNLCQVSQRLPLSDGVCDVPHNLSGSDSQ